MYLYDGSHTHERRIILNSAEMVRILPRKVVSLCSKTKTNTVLANRQQKPATTQVNLRGAYRSGDVIIHIPNLSRPQHTIHTPSF